MGSSEAALLAKLNIRPFSYGLIIQSVYESRAVFGPEVLDLTDDDLIKKVMQAIHTVAAFSLATGYPTLASLPHSIVNAYRNVLAIALTNYSFPQAKSIKEYLKDLSKFVAAAGPAVPVATEKKEKVVAAPKEEENKEDSRGRGRRRIWRHVRRF
ncbi:hypothetical protein CBR_g30846 [Chara braunii]|uniref:Uncharacterized protein n=1 Tax=Chara braunii TaxID=69332 RepID=A0A388JXN1_CHABU|nr:hypothetical protein CBR_g30846 [Chara braunii]|eukprot:GBG62528.1 hypothetical protein CBR_g30846 [Chara braunii]